MIEFNESYKARNEEPWVKANKHTIPTSGSKQSSYAKGREARAEDSLDNGVSARPPSYDGRVDLRAAIPESWKPILPRANSSNQEQLVPGSVDLLGLGKAEDDSGVRVTSYPGSGRSELAAQEVGKRSDFVKGLSAQVECDGCVASFCGSGQLEPVSLEVEGQHRSGPGAAGRQGDLGLMRVEAGFDTLPSVESSGQTGRQMGHARGESTPLGILPKASNKIWSLHQPSEVLESGRAESPDLSVLQSHDRLTKQLSCRTPGAESSSTFHMPVADSPACQELSECGVHKAKKAISSQSVYPLEQVQASEGEASFTLEQSGARQSLRQDLTGTLPGWVRAKMSKSECASKELHSRSGFLSLDPRQYDMDFRVSIVKSTASSNGGLGAEPPASRAVSNQFAVQALAEPQAVSRPGLQEPEVRARVVVSPDPKLVGFSPDVSSMHGPPNPLDFSPALPLRYEFSGGYPDAVSSTKPLGCSPLLSGDGYGGQVPSATSTSDAAQAGTKLQVLGIVGNQVAAQAFAESQGPGAMSNKVAAQASAESQEPGVVSNQPALSSPVLQVPLLQNGLSDSEVAWSHDVGAARLHQIFYPDEADSHSEDLSLDPCWTRPWTSLDGSASDLLSRHGPCAANERPRILCASQVSTVGPRPSVTSILRRGPNQSVTWIEAHEPRQVTWEVPLEVSCAYLAPEAPVKPPKVRVRSSVSLPDLADNSLRRLILFHTDQVQGRQPLVLPLHRAALSGAPGWRRLLSSPVSAMSPAPSTPLSWSPRHPEWPCLYNMPGHVSISGYDCGNVLAWVCIKARWGETPSPDTDFKISPETELKVSLCADPGQDQKS